MSVETTLQRPMEAVPTSCWLDKLGPSRAVTALASFCMAAAGIAACSNSNTSTGEVAPTPTEEQSQNTIDITGDPQTGWRVEEVIVTDPDGFPTRYVDYAICDPDGTLVTLAAPPDAATLPDLDGNEPQFFTETDECQQVNIPLSDSPRTGWVQQASDDPRRRPEETQDYAICLPPYWWPAKATAETTESTQEELSGPPNSLIVLDAAQRDPEQTSGALVSNPQIDPTKHKSSSRPGPRGAIKANDQACQF